MCPQNSLLEDLRAILKSDAENPLQRAVETLRESFAAITCTLHEAEYADGSSVPILRLRGSVGLPDAVRAIAERIPFGKGMAGICAERREPVTVCNLQTDDSGVVRPGAKETAVAGALVVPLLRDQRVVGTLGVGKSVDHEYGEEEIGRLEACGELISDYFAQSDD